jgi:hypothetical protein
MIAHCREYIKQAIIALNAIACWRRSKFDHLCRLNFDQGLRLSC